MRLIAVTIAAKRHLILMVQCIMIVVPLILASIGSQRLFLSVVESDLWK